MADLILLNGPPASGKSTIAQRYVDAHPMTLNLDIDVLRGLIGAWAADCDARFVEVGLWLPRSEAISAFAERSDSPATQAHIDAAKLVEQSTSSDPVGAMYDAFVALTATRSQTVRVDVTRGNIDRTYQRFMEAIA